MKNSVLYTMILSAVLVLATFADCRASGDDPENTLALESWMFESQDQICENALTVEKWMCSAECDFESSLCIDAWMAECYAAPIEAELPVEQWMSQEEYVFEEVLEIDDSWMRAK